MIVVVNNLEGDNLFAKENVSRLNIDEAEAQIKIICDDGYTYQEYEADFDVLLFADSGRHLETKRIRKPENPKTDG